MTNKDDGIKKIPMSCNEQSSVLIASKLVTQNSQRKFPMLGTIVLVILILMLLGAIPAWPHSKNWGYAPSGGLGLVVLILIILIVMGRI